MSCRELFSEALSHSRLCPVRLFPRCHPKAFCEVFVDGRTNEIVLTCGQCDRPIARVHVRHLKKPTGKEMTPP